MKAILRAGTKLAAAALFAAPAPALAQSSPTPAPTSNSTSPDTIGPSELQNFNLKGTVTRQADQPAATTPARPQTAPVRPPVLVSRSSPAPVRTARPAPSPALSSSAPTNSSPTPAPPTPVPTPVQTAPSVATPTPAPPPTATVPDVNSAPASDPFAMFRGLPLWPWIAVALAAALAGGFLLWRRWPREEFAGQQFDLLAPASPEPELPAPAASPPPPRRPVSSGLVASRLRPSLELGFHPLRCQVDEDQVAIEFELELFNAGAAPARAVLAEASLLNASATQDHELAAFFANPNGVGERLALIPPMKRVSFKSQVVAPRAAVQEYELAGRKAFVPVIAFNALYEWSGGKAQSSAAYLVGRDTQKDKLGPLRLDRGAREFSGLGARPLPSAVRT